jgi:hypothetical protein
MMSNNRRVGDYGRTKFQAQLSRPKREESSEQLLKPAWLQFKADAEDIHVPSRALATTTLRPSASIR